MKFDTPILVTLGKDQQPGDWGMAAALRAAGFTNVRERTESHWNASDPDAVTLADLQWARVVIGYSWAQASEDDWTSHGATLAADLVIKVLPVRGNPLGDDNIHYTDLVGQAVVFNLDPNYAFPISEPLDTGPWYAWGDAALLPAISARRADGTPMNPRINVNLKTLPGVKRPPWWTLGLWLPLADRVANHTRAEQNPALLGAMVNIVKMTPPVS